MAQVFEYYVPSQNGYPQGSSNTYCRLYIKEVYDGISNASDLRVELQIKTSYAFGTYYIAGNSQVKINGTVVAFPSGNSSVSITPTPGDNPWVSYFAADEMTFKRDAQGKITYTIVVTAEQNGYQHFLAQGTNDAGNEAHILAGTYTIQAKAGDRTLGFNIPAKNASVGSYFGYSFNYDSSLFYQINAYNDDSGAYMFSVNPKKSSGELHVENWWFNFEKHSPTIKVRFELRAYPTAQHASSQQIGSVDIQFVTISADSTLQPTYSSTVEVINTMKADGSSVPSNIEGWIYGYSKPKVVINPEDIQSWTAPISKIVIEFDYKTYTAEFTGDEPVSVEYTLPDTVIYGGRLRITVHDGRSFTQTIDYNINVTEYKSPTIAFTHCYRCDIYGEMKEAGECAWVEATANCSPVNNADGEAQNSMTLSVTIESNVGMIIDSKPLNNNEGKITGLSSDGGGLLSAGLTYYAEIKVVDLFGSTAKKRYPLAPEKWAIFIKDGGDGVAFGQMASLSGYLELPGSWEIKIGETTLSEDDLKALLRLIE